MSPFRYQRAHSRFLPTIVDVFCNLAERHAPSLILLADSRRSNRTDTSGTVLKQTTWKREVSQHWVIVEAVRNPVVVDARAVWAEESNNFGGKRGPTELRHLANMTKGFTVLLTRNGYASFSEVVRGCLGHDSRPVAVTLHESSNTVPRIIVTESRKTPIEDGSQSS